MKKINSKSYYDKTEFDKVCDDFGASIRIIFGQRSNGKTYQVLADIINNFKENGKQGYYVRRWADDLKTHNIASLFNKHDSNVEYNRHIFYLDKKPFCYTTALTQIEHFKGTTVPETVNRVLFDEIFPRGRELPTEFSDWQDTVSTIVRDRGDVIIYMVGNTLRRTSCYLTNYNIDINKLTQGECSLIEVHKRGGEVVKVGVDWCETNTFVTRNSNKYIIDLNAENMLLKGEFETKKHKKSIRHVTYDKWTNALKTPISIYGNTTTFFNVYIYDGIFIFVKEKRPSRFIYYRYKQPILDERSYIMMNEFPFASVVGCSSITKQIYDAVRCDQFLAETDGDAEIIQELLNVRKL